MSRPKFATGERVEVFCYHEGENGVARDWLRGTVIQTDDRMVAVRFDANVYTNQGWRIAERILWCAHGSPRIRRPGDEQDHTSE